MTSLPSLSTMRRAFAARDSRFESIFFVGVRTTRIFCRPTCPARRPRPENIEFFGDAAGASAAGYRPCLRCKPAAALPPSPELVRRLASMIDGSPGERWGDKRLAALGYDPSTVRRQFRRAFGCTFQEYHRSRRLGTAAGAVAAGVGLLQTGLAAGFESASGFRDAFRRLFGDAPLRTRGTLHILRAARFETPLGPMIAAADDAGVRVLDFADAPGLVRHLKEAARRLGAAVLPGEHAHLDRLGEELKAYFAEDRAGFAVPDAGVGSPFQRRVWAEMRRIPFGETVSYAELARRAGRPGAARAVGRANGSNPVAVLVPCHRVIASDGELRGYAGGVWRKRRLLDLERRALTTSSARDN